MDPEPEALLMPDEAARIFRVDVRTLARWSDAGLLHPIRTPGGHRRYREAEVRALIEARTTDRSE